MPIGWPDPGDPLRYDMRVPCANCPFRTDNPTALRPGLATLATQQIAFEDGLFACHKTTPGGKLTDKAQHCAGALIAFGRLPKPPGVPMFASVAEFVAFHDGDLSL